MKRRNMRRKSNYSLDKPDTKKMKKKADLRCDKIRMNLCNKIAFEMMLQKLGQGKTGENVVSSPLSINLLLNMLVYGLQEGSDGQIELMNALDLKSVKEANRVSSKLMSLISTESTRGPILSMANGVWTDSKFPIKPQFHELATQIYQAGTRSFDFINNVDQVVKDVNLWAAKKTKGLIKEIVSRDSFGPNIVLVLANALYFKGAWKLAFRRSMTREKDFYVQSGKRVKVSFMNNTDNYCYKSFDGFKLVELPYRSGDDKTKELSIYVFLPDEINGLENMLRDFNSDPLLVHAKCNKELMEKTKVSLSIPKFKFSSDFNPSDIMKKMGLSLPDMGELTNMVDSLEQKKVGVYDVMQKSYIEVNEEGTVAASVTCGRKWAMGEAAPRPILSFVADHPFFFMIKDEITGATLFTGIIRNPLE